MINQQEKMNISLDNKHALVCGSSSGIGRAIAIEFARLGAQITLVARNEELLLAVKKALSVDKGQTHHHLVADFSDSASLRAIIKAYLETVPPINILVNNTAGLLKGDIVTTKTAAFQEGFNLQFISSHLLTQLLLPGMIDSDYGRIINILSTSVKQPITGLGVANTIRGAVANWSKTLATELGEYDITVNNILPGSTDTDRLQSYQQAKAEELNLSIESIQEQSKANIPLQRFARPEEIAYAACFLASPAAAYITGINLPVDGGKLNCL